MKRLAFVLTALLLSSQAFAGAWVQAPDAVDITTTLSDLNTSAVYDQDGHRTRYPNQGASAQDQLNTYVEYGLTPTVTLLGNFFVDNVIYKDSFSSSHDTGFANQELGARYLLSAPEAPWVRSVQAVIVVPTYGTNRPNLGSGHIDGQLSYALGHELLLFDRKGYVSIDGGVRLRGGSPADELRADFDMGLQLSSHWALQSGVYAIKSLNNGASNVTGQFINANNYDLYKLQLSLAYAVTPTISVEGGWVDNFAGRNTTAGSSVFVGLRMKLP